MTGEWKTGHRAGFVVLIGRPNVGKSSLVNALVGEDLASTSPVPQTTRRRLLGILSTEDAQVVFVDTPGIHQPQQRLGQMMVESADKALEDADLVLAVVDCTREPGEEDALVLKRAAACSVPKYLLINKIDAASPGHDFRREFERLATLDRTFHTSALTREGLPEVLAATLEVLPESPPFFPPDQISDLQEREIAADLIREAALARLQEELPHATAVMVDEWKERPNGVLYIHAILYVERETQKAMVIGRNGQMLKTIGTLARERLEHWLEQKVFLDLHVKVLKGWRKNEQALRWLGFMRQ